MWESVGELGAYAVAADHQALPLDVVLFVTRLDSSSVAKRDNMLLAQLCHLFGQHILHAIVVVLTRGASLPPLNLSFTEFVRLRSDLLYLQLKQVFHPVQVAGGVGVQYAPDLIPHQQTTLTAAALAKLERQITRHWLHHKPSPAVQKLHTALLNDDATDAGSTTDVPPDFLDDLFHSGVYPLDRRVFVDPPRPPFVVVELAHTAPCNERGQLLLPNGQPWIHTLVDTIERTAERVRAQRDDGELERRLARFAPPPLPWWRRLHREIVCGGIRTVVMSLLFVYLGVLTYTQMLERERKRKKAQHDDDDDDVLLKLDDEEFKQLTTPDPGTDGSVVLSSEPQYEQQQQQEQQLKDDEKEFFGTPQEHEGIKNERAQTDTQAEAAPRKQVKNEQPLHFKGGDLDVDWDKLEDGERVYTDSYTPENRHKWKHLETEDD